MDKTTFDSIRKQAEETITSALAQIDQQYLAKVQDLVAYIRQSPDYRLPVKLRRKLTKQAKKRIATARDLTEWLAVYNIDDKSEGVAKEALISALQGRAMAELTKATRKQVSKLKNARNQIERQKMALDVLDKARYRTRTTLRTEASKELNAILFKEAVNGYVVYNEANPCDECRTHLGQWPKGNLRHLPPYHPNCMCLIRPI